MVGYSIIGVNDIGVNDNRNTINNILAEVIDKKKSDFANSHLKLNYYKYSIQY